MDFGKITAGLAVILALAAGRAGGAGFELLSRSLLQQPARDAEFFDEGIVLAAGGAIAVFHPLDEFPRYALLPLEREPLDAAVNGRAVYVCINRTGVATIDISDPLDPRIAGSISSRGAERALICAGALVISDSETGISLFDISSPLHPCGRRELPLERGPVSISSSGDILALSYPERTVLFRIDPGGEGSILSSVTPDAKPVSCFLDRSVLYIVTSAGRTQRWDIEDPSTPRPIGDLEVSGAVSIDLAGPRGIAMTEGGLLVPFDRGPGARTAVGDPVEADYGKAEAPAGTRMKLLERVRGGRVSREFKGTSVRYSRGMVLTVHRSDGVSLYREDGERLSFMGTVTTKGFAIDLVARGQYLYVANGEDGLRIGRTDDAGSIEWVGHVQTTVARDVALDGELLYLADGGDGLRIYDLKDPVSPAPLARYSSEWYLSAVESRDGYVFLAGGLGGVEVVDVRDPSRPNLLWKRKLSEVRGIFADPEYFYVPDGFRGFKIYRYGAGGVSAAGSLDTPGWNCDVFAAGDILYLAEGGKGLACADISDRDKPFMLGAVETGAIAREIHAIKGTVFVATQTAGVTAIDVTDPLYPVVSARYDTVDDARGVFADGRFVYVASSAGGVYIFRYHD